MKAKTPCEQYGHNYFVIQNDTKIVCQKCGEVKKL
jgi:hypothetical protein